MMTDWLLVLIILSMPWKLGYFIEVMDVPVVWQNSRCRNGMPGCYYSDTIYLQREWRQEIFDPELKRVVIHELQHHFQCQMKIWQNPGGWDEFSKVVDELIESGSLTETQTERIQWISDRYFAFDLHAELPFILDGKIPSELADWYPWFYFSAKEK